MSSAGLKMTFANFHLPIIPFTRTDRHLMLRRRPADPYVACVRVLGNELQICSAVADVSRMRFSASRPEPNARGRGIVQPIYTNFL